MCPVNFLVDNFIINDMVKKHEKWFYFATLDDTRSSNAKQKAI